MKRHLIIPFFIPHAGCPYRCLFCNQKLISGESQPFPDYEQIQQRIRQWLERSPGRSAEVAFYGGSFTMLHKKIQEELLEAVQPFCLLKSVHGIRISTRPDALDEHILSFLAVKQVRTIEIGVQSLDEQVLVASGRGHTAVESIDAIKRVKALGFKVGVQLLPGLPEDSYKKAIDSIRGVIMAGAQFVRIYPAVVLEGTALAESYRAGQYQPPDLKSGINTCARMLKICLKKDIPVIRIGLQAEDGLTKGDAVFAGCWHPALGQMVFSKLYQDLVVMLADRLNSTDDIKLSCNPSRLSDVIGNAGSNLKHWQKIGLPIYKVRPDSSLKNDQVCLENVKYKIIDSIITGCIYEDIDDA